MSGGSKTKTQTTTVNSAPWVGVQPHLTQSYGQYQDYINNPSPTPARNNAIDTLNGFAGNTNYNAGVGRLQSLSGDATQTYNANTDGLTQLGQAGALNGQGLAAQGVLSGLASNGAMDATGYGTLTGLAGSGVDSGADRTALQRIMNGDNTDAQATAYNRSVLNGDYLTQNNPYFQDMVNNSIASARPSVDAAFASSGRLGSGSHAAAFADSANRAATTLGYQDYQNERNNQTTAANSLNSAALQNAGLQSLAAQADAGIAATDFSSRLSAGQGLLSAGFQNAGVQNNAASGLLNSQQQDAATRMNAMQSAVSADQGLRNSWQNAASSLVRASTVPGEQYTQAANLEAANSPEQRLATYIQLLNGAQGGTSSQQVPVSSGSGLLTGLGAVSGLAGGLGALGRGTDGLLSLGSTVGGWLSDARAKENIRPVGLLHNGQTVYAYNYKDGSPTQIGLLAQEVARDRPEAIGNYGNTGLMSVNYDAATA